jgi:hypothetical protein
MTTKFTKTLFNHEGHEGHEARQMIIRFPKSCQLQSKCIPTCVFFVTFVVYPVFVAFVVKTGGGCYD